MRRSILAASLSGVASATSFSKNILRCWSLHCSNHFQATIISSSFTHEQQHCCAMGPEVVRMREVSTNQHPVTNGNAYRWGLRKKITQEPPVPAVSLKGNMNLSLSSKKQASGSCRPVSILSGTPSKSTPKKVLSHLNTPTSAQKTHGDRFIPSRVGTNLDYSAHKLTFPSRPGTLSSPSESEKRKVVFDKLLSLEGCTSETRVLRFRSAEAENTPTKCNVFT